MGDVGVAGTGILTALLILLVITVLAMVLYSLVRSRRRRYPARELGFARLAGSDTVFHDRVAAPYLAATPRYRLDNIFHKTGPGCDIYSYDVYPPGSRVYSSTLALVDGQMDLPRFSVTRCRDGLTKAGSLGRQVRAGVWATPSETRMAFPDYPAFAAGYLVTSPGDPTVHEVLAPRAIEWLTARRDEPGMREITTWAAGPLLVWGWDETATEAPDRTAHLQTSLQHLLALHGLLDTASPG